VAGSTLSGTVSIVVHPSRPTSARDRRIEGGPHAAALGLIVVWLALIVALLLAGRRYERLGLGEMLRLLPDLLRLLKRLAGDRSLPRGVRVRLWLLLVYLAVPIDLIPDFIPVIGYADDAIIVALALRSVTRRAGLPALQRHWPGNPSGLAAVLRAAGIADPSAVNPVRAGRFRLVPEPADR
jgi:uncharacterized membrane protein YkvA (DUF1232 family)